MDYSSFFFFFSSRRRHTRFDCDWSSDVCSSDLDFAFLRTRMGDLPMGHLRSGETVVDFEGGIDRKSTRLNSSHSQISYAVFCLKKKKLILRPPPVAHTAAYPSLSSICRTRSSPR